MTTNKTLLWALGGAAAAGLIYRYLGTEQGKQVVDKASGYLRDIGSKVMDYAKSNVTGTGSSDSTPAQS